MSSPALAPREFATAPSRYHSTPSSGSLSSTTKLEADFQRLAAIWRDNTQFSSSITEIVLDPAYQKIIGMGVAVVPFILKELKKQPEHWYWALGAITQANPPAIANVPDGDINAACRAWLDWGKRRGIID